VIARRLILVATLPLVLVTGCQSSGPDIRTAAVGRADVSEVVEAPATVVARASSTLAAPADGRVAELRVRDGQRVSAGQVLAVLDSPSARARLTAAERADAEAASGRVSVPSSGLGTALARADSTAQRSFAAARAAALRISDAQARQQALAAVAAAQAQYAAAAASAASAVAALQRGLGSLGSAANALARAQRVQTRAAVESARAVVDALILVAPISGVVSLGSASSSGAAASDLLGSLPADVSSLLGGTSSSSGTSSSVPGGGTAVAPGVPVQSGAPLLTVTDLSSLSLTAEVDETDVFLVKPGVPARVELDAVPGARYSARVVSVDLAPATSARGGVTYRVRLALGTGTDPNGDPAPRPRPGMSAVADLTVRSARAAVAVPAAAIIRDGDRDAVWVAVGGRAVRRVVQLGAEGDELVQVTSGLALGERVVVRGADAVRAGQKLPK
jgi:multidrug efflux pump subunit AcrA (membrane-fusion protein)